MGSCLSAEKRGPNGGPTKVIVEESAVAELGAEHSQTSSPSTSSKQSAAADENKVQQLLTEPAEMPVPQGEEQAHEEVTLGQEEDVVVENAEPVALNSEDDAIAGYQGVAYEQVPHEGKETCNTFGTITFWEDQQSDAHRILEEIHSISRHVTEEVINVEEKQMLSPISPN